jgi:hypothetical protein
MENTRIDEKNNDNHNQEDGNKEWNKAFFIQCNALHLAVLLGRQRNIASHER